MTDENPDLHDPGLAEGQQDDPTRRRPLGWLALLVVALVAGGYLVLRNDGEPEAPPGPALPSASSLPTGDAAPDFNIELIGGGEFHLAGHLEDDGRPVLLNLWASWCGPCRAEMPDLDAAAKAHPEIQFIGVAVEDSPSAARAFAEEIGVSYPLAVDESDRVGRRYPSPGLPATFFITSDGTIARVVYGQIHESQLEDLLTTVFS